MKTITKSGNVAEARKNAEAINDRIIVDVLSGKDANSIYEGFKSAGIGEIRALLPLLEKNEAMLNGAMNLKVKRPAVGLAGRELLSANAWAAEFDMGQLTEMKDSIYQLISMASGRVNAAEKERKNDEGPLPAPVKQEEPKPVLPKPLSDDEKYIKEMFREKPPERIFSPRPHVIVSTSSDIAYRDEKYAELSPLSPDRVSHEDEVKEVAWRFALLGTRAGKGRLPTEADEKIETQIILLVDTNGWKDEDGKLNKNIDNGLKETGLPEIIEVMKALEKADKFAVKEIGEEEKLKGADHADVKMLKEAREMLKEIAERVGKFQKAMSGKRKRGYLIPQEEIVPRSADMAWTWWHAAIFSEMGNTPAYAELGVLFTGRLVTGAKGAVVREMDEAAKDKMLKAVESEMRSLDLQEIATAGRSLEKAIEFADEEIARAEKQRGVHPSVMEVLWGAKEMLNGIAVQVKALQKEKEIGGR